MDASSCEFRAIARVGLNRAGFCTFLGSFRRADVMKIVPCSLSKKFYAPLEKKIVLCEITFSFLGLVVLSDSLNLVNRRGFSESNSQPNRISQAEIKRVKWTCVSAFCFSILWCAELNSIIHALCFDAVQLAVVTYLKQRYFAFV